MTTFAEKVISFCKGIEFNGSLPPGISVMNPYRDNPEIVRVITQFYTRFYNDYNPRHMILGINPGRFGGGVTGIPFTDTKRLREKCGITISDLNTFETSSVFVYEMIDAYGGAEQFYSGFYINSVSPLGFTSTGKNGKQVNYNYYDSKSLTSAVLDFIVDNIHRQLGFGINREIGYCMGAGRNFRFLSLLNDEHHFFERIVPLEHPRYIMQYRSKMKGDYINDYLEKFHLIEI